MQSLPLAPRFIIRASALTATLGLVFCACSGSTATTRGDTGVGAGPGSAGGSSGASATAGRSGAGTAGGSSTAGSGSSNAGSSGSGFSGGFGTSGSSSGSAGSGAGGSIPTQACPGLPFDSSTDGGLGDQDGGACTGVDAETESIPVDMFMMMDRSISNSYTISGTTMTRWDALNAAVKSFAQDPAVVNIGGGIGFFSKSGNANDAVDCDVNNYSTPAVGIGPLGTTGSQMVDAIGQVTPGGLTPIVPALEGAITYARGWSAAHPGRATVVVLVSDGFPTQCSSDPADVTAVAKAGFQGSPSIRTYVIGVGDVARFNLQNYADAGGTGKPFLTDSSDVAGSFARALENITNEKLSCQYKIPTPTDAMMKVDPEKVQVAYTPAVGPSQQIPRVDGLGGCAISSNGGWYYDNPANPTSIDICPCSCANFAAGSVSIRLGCAPIIILH